MWIILSAIVVVIAGIALFIHQPQFGRTPKNERQERIKSSPNYRDGKFQNLSVTPQLTSDKGFIGSLIDFVFKKKEGLKPEKAIPSVKTDLHQITVKEDILVWFGHGSYFIQIEGKRILVDPVFSKAASPVSFVNKAFEGTNIYSAVDIPDIDYLIISHDHWDHLDYPTVMELKPRIRKVICGLGVGEHFERWGFDQKDIVEMDWNEEAILDSGFEIFCLPTRHFSGRSISPNQSLWASYLLKTPESKIYIGGDGGYDTHFSAIGKRFGDIDLAILENGQYDMGWKYIHMLPDETLKAGKDLRAKNVLPVHNSKFALGNHAWDEPLRKVSELHDKADFSLWTPMIGQKVNIKDSVQVFSRWWEGL
ncbi:MAG: MBL fold metallo-hydrolase [Bacteroidales bacterium]|nr:MBL fold metallo-hydrolase [Bacteroidales bacterium]